MHNYDSVTCHAKTAKLLTNVVCTGSFANKLSSLHGTKPKLTKKR